jgi:hypothetical protein
MFSQFCKLGECVHLLKVGVKENGIYFCDRYGPSKTQVLVTEGDQFWVLPFHPTSVFGLLSFDFG